ncbi:MAG: putative DNA modification/repair radical SAM protein, partial [Oscillospiraceae bacterium]|nr:putative DNA modification/repair radical SAM protein [Oscillospiraceae bacterium]
LLKVLLTNYCIYDCAYCQNRRSADAPRAMFDPRELAELMIGFYRRNYIEGLFLSSGIVKSPDYTMELMCETLRLIRGEYGFRGYIHAKAIPGASPETVERLGLLADRISVNLELPSEKSLSPLAPDKPRANIFGPMKSIRDGITENRGDLAVYRNAPTFAPAGQSTQMVIGASPETDFQIVRLAQGLYNKYSLKRVFYSAYIPVANANALLPQDSPVPLLREHRLYQADWLMRFYGFHADEILTEEHPHLDPYLDPKCNWAMNNLHIYPVEVNTADLELLLRVPGIGPAGARKIVAARHTTRLTFEDLKKLRIVMRRAVYFITCNGRMAPGASIDHRYIYQNLLHDCGRDPVGMPMAEPPEQLTLFAPKKPAALPWGGETPAVG